MRKIFIYIIVTFIAGCFASCSKSNTPKDAIQNVEIKGVVQRTYKSEKKIDLLDSNNQEWSVYFSFDTPITLKNGTTGYFDNIQDGQLSYINGFKEEEFTIHAKSARQNEKVVTSTSFTYYLFFPNSLIEPQTEDCKTVYEVPRKLNGSIAFDTIPKFTIVLTDLIQGPNDAEKAEGYFTSIPNTSEIQDINYNDKDHSLWIDFKSIPISGSCNVINAREQIVSTFKQFEEVEIVHILLNGKESEALQP